MKVRTWFVCCTPYHLFVSMYYSMQVEWKTDVERVLVWMNNTKKNIDIKPIAPFFDKVFEKESHLKETETFIKKQWNKINEFGWNFSRTTIGRMCKDNSCYNVLICYTDADILTGKMIEQVCKTDKHYVILVEEGLSIYLPMLTEKRSFLNIMGNFVRGLKASPYIGKNKNIDAVIAKQPSKLPDIQVKGRKVIKQNELFFDDRWMEKIKFLNRTMDFRNETKKIFLWIGEPFDAKEVPNDVEVIEDIFMYISRLNQFKIVIKPHPTEDKSKYKALEMKYNAVCINDESTNWLPVEMLVSFLSPDIVCTPLSSAGKNISQMGIGCKVFYCFKLFGVDYTEQMNSAGVYSFPNVYNIMDVKDFEKYIAMPSEEIKVSYTLSDEDLAFIQEIQNKSW